MKALALTLLTIAFFFSYLADTFIMELFDEENVTTTAPPPYYPTNDTCNYMNRTDYQYVDHWEGIPENLLLNVVSWLVSISIDTSVSVMSVKKEKKKKEC